MAIGPVLEVIELAGVEDSGHNCVVDVPVHGDLTANRVLWGGRASVGDETRRRRRVDETMFKGRLTVNWFSNAIIGR